MKRKWWLSLTILFLLVGCSTVSKRISGDGKKFTIEEITVGGVIDVEKAKQSGYIPVEERAELGYIFTYKNNEKARKKGIKQEKEITAYLNELTSGLYGREMEVFELSTPFPYDAVSVTYKSVDEPLTYGMTSLGLSDSAYFNEGSIKEITTIDMQEETVRGILAMAYRSEFKKMREYIEKTYPQYQGYPQPLMEFNRQVSTVVNIQNVWNYDDEGEMTAKDFQEIYELFKENPKRSDEEWRSILAKYRNIDFDIELALILKDPTVIPTEQMSNHLLKDIKGNELFSITQKHNVHIESSLYEIGDNGSMISAYNSYDSQ